MTAEDADRRAADAELPEEGTACLGPLAGRSLWLRRCGIALFGLVVLAIAALATLFWYVSREQNSAFLREHLIKQLAAGLGPANRLALDEARIRFSGTEPTFSIGGLSIRNPDSGAEATLDRAEFALSPFSLWSFAPEARAIRFDGLRLVLPNAAAAESPLEAQEMLTLLRATLAGVNFVVAGDDPAFRDLVRIEGRSISIVRKKPDGTPALLHEGLTTDVRRDGEKAIIAQIRKGGAAQGITISARKQETSDGGSAVTAGTGDLTAGELMRLSGSSFSGIDPNMQVMVTFTSRLSSKGTLLETGVSVAARNGHVVPPDPDMPSFDLDEAALDLRMRPDAPDVLIDRLQVRFAETNFLLNGTLSPIPGANGDVRLKLKADRADLDRLSASESPVALDFAEAEGVISANLRSLTLEQLRIREDAGELAVAGRYSLDGGGLMATNLEGRNFDLRKALRVWPVWVAPNVRRWIVEHAESGMLSTISLQSELAGEVLKDAFSHRPIPDGALNVTYQLDDVKLRPVLDAAPVSGMSATGLSTGRRAEVDITKAYVEPKPGQRFDISGAKIRVANTSIRPALLELSIPAQGRLDGLITFLSAPSLRQIAGLPEDAAVSDGAFQGQATLALPLSTKASPKETRVEIRAETRNVVIDNVVKGEKLEAGAFTFISKGGQISGKGEARVLGVVSQIEFRSDNAKGPVAQLKANFDEAALSRRGFDFKPALSGPVAVTINVPLGRAAPIEFELDLARNKIEAGVPGLAKKAGQAGKAKFALQTRADGSSQLDGFELDFSPLSLRGRIDLLKDGQFSKAEFSQFRISGGDNAKLTVEKARGVTRLALSGNAFDIRPFMRGFQKPADFDLDLQTTVLVGFNGELLSAADIKASRRNGRITALAAKGQFGGAPFLARSLDSRNDQTLIQVSSHDAGALVRFLDIYSRMQGGRLTADLQVGANSQQGLVQVRDFTIRDEPGLRQVAASNRQPSSAATPADDIQFTKFRADFVRKTGRLDLAEAVMWGAQIGGTLEGYIDYASDTVSLKGAFVPAYGLNNLFANVPLFGPILGGSQYEGLFAVPFVISGRASAPVLRTNPVSAIAPGFLRKIFELRREK